MSLGLLSRPTVAPLLGALLLLGACGPSGSYELRWSVGCDKPGDPACAVRSVRDCSLRGIDAVEVLAQTGDTLEVTRFACFSIAEGAVGRGPGLPTGPATLEVYGLNPGGLRLIGPVRVAASIPESGLVSVHAALPAPPACGDGMDDDGDGLVDLFDPQCADPKDPDELK
ncbi:MAG: hypothetical protein IT371_26740 [Deltaproteobacteria bacterium]|nr:hypothetical protein [Deltaproteobacteria bacterium]